MAFAGEYKCSRCGKQEQRERLTTKRAVFQEMGVKPHTLRTRVVDWLCPSCVKADADWNLEPYTSPGMRPATPTRYLNKEQVVAAEEA